MRTRHADHLPHFAGGPVLFKVGCRAPTRQAGVRIAKKERVVELLAEKQALITQVFAEDLDPNVPMKYSGCPLVVGVRGRYYWRYHTSTNKICCCLGFARNCKAMRVICYESRPRSTASANPAKP